jgi:hypothetical protein
MNDSEKIGCDELPQKPDQDTIWGQDEHALVEYTTYKNTFPQ